jgi:glycerate kinase
MMEPLTSSTKVVLAFDKFRGTASAEELVASCSNALEAHGVETIGIPLADGGEGSLSVVGGANKRTTVTGPLGDPVEAEWRLQGRTAFIEMAAASGRALVGDNNDPLAADTLGTGELISTAVELGARTIYVMVGGSATTDGGWGAIRALPPAPRFKEIDLVVACDVDTGFVDAARVFGPQKGATPAQVKLLTGRLVRLVQVYQERFGVDVSVIPGAGAAGGLAGGLAAMGARLESGFEILAEHAELDVALIDAHLAVTGEGLLDEMSFQGKVVGGVTRWATAANVPVLAVVGEALVGVATPENAEVVSLVERFGAEAAFEKTVELVTQVVLESLPAIMR